MQYIYTHLYMYTYKYDQKQPKLEVVNPQASGFSSNSAPPPGLGCNRRCEGHPGSGEVYGAGSSQRQETLDASPGRNRKTS